MKKRILAFVLTALLIVSLFAGCSKPAEDQGTTTPDTPPVEAFTPAASGEWIEIHNTGSGADMFTRALVTTIETEKITTTSLPVVYKNEGNGVVGLQYVAGLKGDAANNTLVTVGGMDVTEANEIAGFSFDALRPLAVLQEEIPLLNRGKDCKYEDFAAAVEAMRGGTQVIFTGPSGDYILMAEKLRDVLGLDETVFTYMPADSGKAGLTNLMGGHADFALALPSTSLELIQSGDIIPEWVYNDIRYSFGELTYVPTYKEYMKSEMSTDVDDLKWAIYRIVCASGNMTDAAAEYWLGVLKTATTSKAWEEHCATFSCNAVFITGDEVKAIW